MFAAFGRRAASHGIRSALSVPLKADGTAGALNLYAAVPAAFGATEVHTAEIFARHAAGALTVAHQANLVGHMHAALTSRAIIDQAIGVIMAQNRCTPDVASTMLRTASQNRNVKMRQLAAEIIAGVSRKPPEPPAVS
jgi:hypothetical protein